MWSLQTVTIPTQRCGAVGILALQRGEDVNRGMRSDDREQMRSAPTNSVEGDVTARAERRIVFL